MAGSKNIIRKQTLHFQYNGNADGFALQKEVSVWCNINLIPEIEQQLEEFSQDGKYVTIDKIEINAEVDSDNWKQYIKDELISELRQKISRYKPVLSDIKKTTEERDAKLDKLIIFYLKTGYLPWWGRAFLDNDFRTIFRNWITEEKSATRIKLIREELENIVSQTVAVRIVNQVPRKLFYQFIKSIYKEYAEIILQFEAFFESIILNKISKEKHQKITKQVYVLFIYSVLKNKGKVKIESILPLIFKELDMFQILPQIIKMQPEEARVNINPVVRYWQKLVEYEQEKLKKERRLTPDKSIEKLLKPETEDREEVDAEKQEGIYIDNAGAVIFIAFIPALFEKLGITEKGKILNPDLAVLTIQYCVSGKVEIEEYELVLPKILCGLDIDFPINTNIGILEEQKSESDLMLQSLISHWTVLKDTSIEGLREAFLNRSGKLSLINDGWVLNVEQKAYDMLLERLPWTFSIIKLPWMKTLLKTEWI